MSELQAQLSQMLDGVLAATAAYAPRVVAGLALLLIALVVATLLERVTRAVMSRIKFDSLVRRTGVDHWLHRLGIRHSLNDVVPRLLYFVLLFLFAREAANALGLEAVGAAIGSLIAYLPKVVAAFLVLLLGGAIAQMAGRAVEELGGGAGLEFSRPLGRFTTGLLMFVLAVMALAQLEVETLLVRDLALVVVGAVALALALSFGLGSRDATRSIIAGFYARQVLEVGEEVEVNGHKGTLEAITATQTLIRSGGRTVVLSNSVFTDSGSRTSM